MGLNSWIMQMKVRTVSMTATLYLSCIYLLYQLTLRRLPSLFLSLVTSLGKWDAT